MRKRIEIVEDSMRKSKEKEAMQVIVKSTNGRVHEVENTETVICLTLQKDEQRIKTIIAGNFSIKTMLEFTEALDVAKEQILKKIASSIDINIENLINILGGKD